MCKSTNHLKNSVSASLKRQKTQDPTSKNFALVMGDSKSVNLSRFNKSNHGDPLDEISRAVSKNENKLMTYALTSPIVQKHERTPSFLNKLPFEIKNTIINNTSQ